MTATIAPMLGLVLLDCVLHPVTATIAPALISAFWIAALVVGAALYALFSALEIGVYRLNRIRLDLHAEAGLAPALHLQRMLRNRNNLLAVLLAGTNAADYVATFAVSALFVLAGAGDRAEWYTLLTAAPALFILCESVPKNVMQRAGHRGVYRLLWLLRGANVALNAAGVAPLLRGWAALVSLLAGKRGARFSPLWHPSLPAIVAEGRASGVLTHFQTVMADRVMHMGKLAVSDVMIPMNRVKSVPADASRPRMIEIIRDYNYSRLPLTEGGKVVGLLDIYDVLAEDAADVRSKMTPPMILPARGTVPDALYHMQRERHTMAVVAAEDGRHVGIVTIKDLVEEIVGELEAW